MEGIVVESSSLTASKRSFDDISVEKKMFDLGPPSLVISSTNKEIND